MRKTKAPAKKGAARKGKKTGTAVARPSGATRNSRLAKFEGKINKLGTDKVSTKALAGMKASVVVSAPGQIAQIIGYMVAADEDTVTLRTNKKSGSSKPVIKVIPRKRIAASIGAPGDNCILWVQEQKEMFVLKETTVKVEGNTAFVTDLKTGGDVIEFPLNNPLVDVAIEYMED